MANTELIFKIRDPNTGLFSSGGMSPSFSKKGKVWKGIGPLKNHLNLVKRRTYEGCEVVEVVVNYDEADCYPIVDLFDARDQKRADAEAERKARRAAAEENKERQLARSLLKKFGPNP